MIQELRLPLLLVALGYFLIWIAENKIPDVGATVDNSTEVRRSITLVTHENINGKWVEQYNVEFDYDNETLFEWHCPERDYKFTLKRREDNVNSKTFRDTDSGRRNHQDS